MGLLSKIFNTDKLEYILREEEEFSVAAPQNWNIEFLTVGDTITPDMWNKQKFINDDWFGEAGWFGIKVYDKTIQDSYLIQSMFFDEGGDEAGADWMVSLNSTTTGKSFGLIGTPEELSTLNSLLKDNYKIVSPDINESNDEFTVDAPKEWNVETLTVGDTITPDMWDQNKIKEQKLNPYFNKPIQILWIEDYKFDDGSIEFSVGLEIKDYEDWDQDWELDYLNDLLKPEYKIVVPDDLNEQDEFSVEAPKDWNVEFLTVGDFITPDMWEDEFKEILISKVKSSDPSTRAHAKKLISRPVQIVHVFLFDGKVHFRIDGKGLLDRDGSFFLNDMLKPQYRVVESINESDEFEVDAPEGWNVETLTVGDTITPDMLKPNNEIYDSQENLYITKIGRYTDGLAAILRNSKGERNLHYLENINNALKPQYKIFTYLKESDEFTVDAPKEWNIQTLYDGDLITPDMWNRENLSKIARLKNYIYDPNQDWTVIEAEDDPNFIIFKSKGGVKIMFKKDTVNSLLKPEYQLDVPINESDEFDVEAPSGWNVETLTVGDTITPDMWDRENLFKIDLLKTFIRDPDQDWTVIAEDDHKFIILKSNEGVVITYKKDTVNSLLKPEYQLDVPINESDEFDVEVPEGWNVKELEIGDTIKRDWLKDEFLETNPTSMGSSGDVKIEKFGKMGGDTYVLLIFPQQGLKIWEEIDHFNTTALKPDYQIIKPGQINESEDEFTVTAPDKWNEIELTVGDYITPDMWDEQAVIDAGEEDEFLNGEIWTIDEVDISYIIISSDGGGFMNWDLQDIQSLLKPQYKIVDSINEEDEFSVEAPEEWNREQFSVGDIITPDMWSDTFIKQLESRNSSYRDDLKFWWRRPLEIVDIMTAYDEESETTDTYFRVVDPQIGLNISIGHWNLHPDVLKKYHFDSIVESEDEFDVEAPKEWNKEYLQIGDIITPDMWDTTHGFGFREPVYIIDVGTDDGGDYVLLNDKQSSNGGESVWDLDEINDNLKHPYKIASGIDLDESDEEFNVEAPDNWNVIELTAGDTITPDMWDVSKLATQLKYYFKKPVKISRIGYSEFDDEELELLVNIDLGEYFADFDINHVNDLLKPQYKVVPDLNESEDDFTVNAPKEWNVTELGVGDYLDSSNLKMQNYSKKYEIVEIIKNRFGNLVLLNVYELVEKPIPGTIRTNKQWETYRQSRIEISDLESKMKPGFKIDVSGLLNESLSKLLEVDDEFSVEAPDGWNEIQLTIGDQITPEMWDRQAVIDAGDEEFLNGKTWTINDFVSRWVYMTSDGGSSVEWNVKDIQSLLKSQYRIVKNINENEDEFSVEAPEGWNKILLTKGDYITPDMWRKIPNRFANPPQSVEIGGFGLAGDANDIEEVRLIKSDMSHVAYSFQLDDLNNELLKPQYQIVHLVGGNNKWKDLYEENESDDEFNVDAPKDWNIDYLGIGDTITPDMWNKKEIKNVTGLSFNKPLKIWWIGTDGISGFIEFEGYNSDYLDVDFVEDLLKPQYKISLSNLNESDDEFNVDAPEDWNVQYLGVGDTIQGKMWNWKNIINWCNRVAGDDHVELNELIRRWEDVYDEGATIDRIIKYGDYHHVEFDSNSGFLRFGPNISTVNNWLSDGYEIEKSLTEEAEDFNVMASPKWDVIELGVGDYINSNMLNPKSNDYTWFSRRKFFIEDIYFDECWTVKLTHVESEHDEEMCVDFLNSDVLNNKYKIMTSLNELLEVDDEFDVEAPKEWDVTELGVGDKITKDMIKNPEFLDRMDEDFEMDFPGVITKIYKTSGNENWGVRIRFQDVGWRKYLPKSKDIKLGLGFNLDSFNDNNLKPQYKIKEPVFELSTLLENEEDFNVSAPESWWEYDGDIEIMFQDTYWYEDENGKEAIVERDGGGILNINDLKQYSYSGWIPFTGNPTSENLTKWYYSIDWDADLIEIFSFDDSIFEVEEDFEWSSAENVDMDRTGFRIRAVSTLKEVEDEFTVKPSKKWDIVYLNKGDFLDNTNSIFNDPNVKYEIGNITSDGEIEVKKYINRGGNFEPQFNRFMKTRKGIVKAKLKPGFDIETSSK